MAKILTWKDMPTGVTRVSPVSRCPSLSMVRNAIESGYQLSGYTPSGAVSSQLLTSVDVIPEGKVLHIICDSSIPRNTGSYPYYSIVLRWNDDPDSINGIRNTRYIINQNTTINVALPDFSDPSEYEIWACCSQNTSSISRSNAPIMLAWMSDMSDGPCILDRYDASLFPGQAEDVYPYNYFNCGSAYTENDSDYYLWLKSPDLYQQSVNFVNESGNRITISLEDGQLEYVINQGSSRYISYENAYSVIGTSPYFSILGPKSEYLFTFDDSGNGVAGNLTRSIRSNTVGSTYYLSEFVRYSSWSIVIS